MAPMPAAKNLMTEREAAQYLNVSHRTLQAYRNKLIGPPWKKLEGHVRYDQADLEQWVNESTVTGQP